MEMPLFHDFIRVKHHGSLIKKLEKVYVVVQICYKNNELVYKSFDKYIKRNLICNV